jgi:uncharacterized iron-regulated membrane protein
MSWWAFRTALQKVHLWAGLALAIPFILIGLSGSILVLQPDLPRWSMPYAPARGPIHSPGEILKAAEPAMPAGTRALRLAMPARTGEPAAIRYGAPGRGQAGNAGSTLYIDPVSLRVLGSGMQNRPPLIFGIARTLHATLYVRNLSDRVFIGWLGIALTLLLLSGLILWWPRPGAWNRALSVKPRLRGFRLHHDLHAVFGFWTLLLLLVVCISGVYLAFPRSFRAAVASVLPIGQDYSYAESGTLPEGQVPLTIDEATTLALQAVPNAEPLNYQLPNRPGQVLVLTMVPKGYGTGVPTLMVSLDMEARQISYVDDFRNYAVGERVVLWQRALHSGLGLGLLYKALVFLSGLLPLLFGITGVRMWWVKRAQRRLVPQIGAAEPAE